ncbi:hypothetical protein D9M68_793570 [compost metagenome]
MCTGWCQLPLPRSSQISAVLRLTTAAAFSGSKIFLLTVQMALSLSNSHLRVRTTSLRLMGGSSRKRAGTWLTSGSMGSVSTSNRSSCSPRLLRPSGPRPSFMSSRLTRYRRVPCGYLLKSMTMSARSAGARRTAFMVSGAGSRLPSLAM